MIVIRLQINPGLAVASLSRDLEMIEEPEIPFPAFLTASTYYLFKYPFFAASQPIIAVFRISPQW